MRWVVPVLFAVLQLVVVGEGFSEVRLPSLFSHDGVLQREMQVPVWGTAEPGERVVVTYAKQTKATVAAEDGNWSVKLEAMPASVEPRDLHVTGKGTPIIIRRLLVGDVWIAVGQSNLAMSLADSEDGPAAVASLKQQPHLRVLAEGEQLASKGVRPALESVSWREPRPSDSAVGLMFAQNLDKGFEGKVPVGLINYLAILPAETWVDPQLYRDDPSLPDSHWALDRSMFLGAVRPTAPYAIRGVIYYQGEYNAGDPEAFGKVLPLLIKSWREAWGRKDLPFLFVQLPGFIEHRGPQDKTLDMDANRFAALRSPGQPDQGWAPMRETMRRVWQSVPHTGMAVTIDCGEPWDIHPRNKRPVADRLYLQALKVAYGRDVVASGPICEKVTASRDRLTVQFSSVGSGLQLRGDDAAFEIASADGDFQPAKAKLVGDSIELSAEDILEPVSVRYAWGKYPHATLYNAEGLPASPFEMALHSPEKLPAQAPGKEEIEDKQEETAAAGKIERVGTEGMSKALAAAPCHVFLIAGQSNAWGYLGDKNEGLDEPVPSPRPGTVFVYDGQSDKIVDASTIKAAIADEYNGAVAGFAQRFAIDYHARTGKRVILLQKAPGNSGTVPGVKYGGGNWPDTYRAELKEKYASLRVFAAADARFAQRWALAGLIWAQGEAEVGLLESGDKTPAQLRAALNDLFEGFVQDYGNDYAGPKDELIKTVLVSVYAFASINSDRFYGDSPLWAASRQVQRDVSERHPQARMVFFATERFNRDGVWQPMNAVHFKQSQYNKIGRVIAAEIAKPGSTLKAPSAPAKTSAKADGAWRIDVSWSKPRGGLPGELPCYRVYRRKADKPDDAMTWIWQHDGALAPKIAFHDEHGLEPDTLYEYRIAARNEFGEALSEAITARTGKLHSDALAGYEATAKPKNMAVVRAVWHDLEKGGHTRGLRSLHLLTADLNAASGPARNLVRGSEQDDRFDMLASDAVDRTATGFEFSGASSMTAPEGLLPLQGPSTLLFDLAWTAKPAGDGVTFMSQGAGYPFADLDGIERRDRRTLLSYSPTGQVRIYQEVFQMFASAESPDVLRPGPCALVYDGRWLSWCIADAKPVRLENDVYFLNVERTPFVVGLSPGNTTASFRLPYVAVWNRALDADELQIVKEIIGKHVHQKR